jgi:acyl-CoA synthetase (NDP forming)
MNIAEQHRSERAHDILPPRRPALDAMFSPKAVALIGATERRGSVRRRFSRIFGRTISVARSFLSAAREVVLPKRIIIIRIGKARQDKIWGEMRHAW